MINLIIEDYCQNCSEFLGHVEKKVDYISEKPFKKVDTTVTCERSDVCKMLYSHIEDEVLSKI